jgi:hypothetical protein
MILTVVRGHLCRRLERDTSRLSFLRRVLSSRDFLPIPTFDDEFMFFPSRFSQMISYVVPAVICSVGFDFPSIAFGALPCQPATFPPSLNVSFGFWEPSPSPPPLQFILSHPASTISTAGSANPRIVLQVSFTESLIVYPSSRILHEIR